MLRVPEAGDADFQFGDVVAADWLFDVYLRDDSCELQHEPQFKGRTDAFFPRPPSTRTREREAGKDRVLVHADDEYVLGFGGRRRGVVVSDECQLEQGRPTADRRGRGRVWLVALMPIQSSEHLEQLRANGNAFDRFLIQPDDAVGFPGGYVDFQRVMALGFDDLGKLTREYTLEDAAREEVRIRWAAHSVRHGPDVAADGVIKLAKLIEANGAPDEIRRLADRDVAPSADYNPLMRSLQRALYAAWSLEGKGLDKAADDFAAVAGPGATLEMIRPLLQVMRDEAQRTIDLLDAEPGNGRSATG